MAQVSEKDLTEAIQWISESAERIRGIQRTLDTANTDLDVDWQGDSRRAFIRVHQIWHERIDKILQTLIDLSESIRQANTNYRAFNEQAVEEISKIEQLLNAGMPSSMR